MYFFITNRQELFVPKVRGAHKKDINFTFINGKKYIIFSQQSDQIISLLSSRLYNYLNLNTFTSIINNDQVGIEDISYKAYDLDRFEFELFFLENPNLVIKTLLYRDLLGYHDAVHSNMFLSYSDKSLFMIDLIELKEFADYNSFLLLNDTVITNIKLFFLHENGLKYYSLRRNLVDYDKDFINNSLYNILQIIQTKLDFIKNNSYTLNSNEFNNFNLYFLNKLNFYIRDYVKTAKKNLKQTTIYDYFNEYHNVKIKNMLNNLDVNSIEKELCNFVIKILLLDETDIDYLFLENFTSLLNDKHDMIAFYKTNLRAKQYELLQFYIENNKLNQLFKNDEELIEIAKNLDFSEFKQVFKKRKLVNIDDPLNSANQYQKIYHTYLDEYNSNESLFIKNKDGFYKKYFLLDLSEEENTIYNHSMRLFQGYEIKNLLKDRNLYVDFVDNIKTKVENNDIHEFIYRLIYRNKSEGYNLKEFNKFQKVLKQKYHKKTLPKMNENISNLILYGDGKEHSQNELYFGNVTIDDLLNPKYSQEDINNLFKIKALTKSEKQQYDLLNEQKYEKFYQRYKKQQRNIDKTTAMELRLKLNKYTKDSSKKQITNNIQQTTSKTTFFYKTYTITSIFVILVLIVLLISKVRQKNN